MKLKQISRRTVSVVLAVLMVLSTLLVGSISTVNAADSVTVYFKNTVNWDASKIYVYFDQGMYWEGNLKNPGTAYKMEKVSGTDDIFFYTYNSSNYGKKIAFSESSMSGWGDFNGNKAAYRSDFSDKATLFTPDTTSSESSHNTVYYSNGSWSTYGGGSGETKPTYYYRGAQNEWKATALTVSDDKTYCYYDKLSAGSSTSNLFKITYSDSDWTTLKDKIDTTKGNVTIKFENDKSDAAWYVESDAYLIVEYNNGTPIVYASTTLPGTTATYTGITASASPSDGGNATVSSDSVTAGSSVDVTATASAGYTFSGWSSDNGTFGDSTSANTTFTPTANNAEAVANFTSTTPATTAKVYLKNTANWGNTLKAYAWSGNGDTYLGDFPGSAMTFVKDNIYSIDVDTNATNIIFNNKISSSDNSGAQTVDLSLTGVAIDGKTYDFSTTELIYDNKENKWSLYNTVKSNITIDEATENGKITNVDPQNNVESGKTVKVTVEPNEGYECSKVTYNGTSANKDSNNVYTFTMPAENVTVSAIFTEKAAKPDRNLYVAGRFAVKGPNGDPVYVASKDNGVNGWATTSENIKFARVGTSDIYKVETGYSLADLASQSLVSGQNLYFIIYDKDRKVNYQPDTSTVLTSDSVGKTYSTSEGNANTFLFSGDSTSYVTLYLDASTEEPRFYFELSESNDFSVTMTQGISNFKGDLKGKSGFDASSISTTNVRKTFDKENNLTVQFYTQMQDTFEYKGEQRYQFGVQGYSILMTTSKGTQVTSTVNVAHPSSGVYTASYTFPENIISATVTPVFTVSEAYAESQGITFTTVYLRYQPNSGTTFQTYEPTYYTWRSNEEDDTTVTVGSKTFENKPEGKYPGQKLLYIGNNTYTVKVQSHLKGILFSYDDGAVQTFDYNEFWKLQQLGYDNITFEIKEGGNETIAAAISNAYAKNGNKVYTDPENISGIVNNDTTLSDEFFLDTNIEGYVIDVFGNKLLDTNRQPIRLTDLKGATNAAKLSELLTKMGKTNAEINALYGARYGDGKKASDQGSLGYGADKYYGMDYPIRVYYFNNLKKLISQQISGYGPIEGAASLEAGKTNRDVYAFSWKYFEGTNASSEEKTFSSEFNVIEKSYEQVPYLVSYKLPLKTNNLRVAGKWYYQRNIAQFNVTVKPALMTNGGIDFDNPIGGTATVNGAGTAVVNQGDTPTFEATNNTGYTFVGFYNAGGTECYGTSTPFSGHKIANNETVYAVFKKLEDGTLKVNNYVYQGTNLDPIPGGGTGKVSATLKVLRYNETTGQYADEWEVYTNGEATVRTKDKIQWVLTGTPLGADTFIAFRQLETNGDFSKYVELSKSASSDGTIPAQPVKQKDGTYTYTSEIQEWNWEDEDFHGAKSWIINCYTDFQKVDVYATLNYHYKDRFGKDKLYVVKVRLSNEEIAHDYKPSDDTIKKNAPYINDLFKDCTWKVTNSELVTKTESRAEIIADHSKAIFDTYVESVNGTGNQLKKPFNTSIDLTTAAENASGAKFSYWKQYDVDSNGQPTGDGVIFSYNREVSVRVTFNRKFKAVYGQNKELFTTNIQDAVYTREQSTNADGTVKYDYVYSDFLTQFETSIAGKTFADVVKNDDEKSGVKNVRFGILTERNMTAAMYDGKVDISTLAPVTNKTNVSSNIKNLYTNITGTNKTTSGWSNSKDDSGKYYDYYYNLYDLSGSVNDLTELGRKDFYFRFDNTANNQGKVYNVYTYVIYEDADGNTQVVLSTPRIMNIYATGIKNTPVVS